MQCYRYTNRLGQVLACGARVEVARNEVRAVTEPATEPMSPDTARNPVRRPEFNRR